MKRRRLAIAVSFALVGCGKNNQQANGGTSSAFSNSGSVTDSSNVAEVKRIVSSRIANTANPTMTLNSEDESWNTVIRLRARSVGWLRPNIGCGDGAPEGNRLRLNPNVENYYGNFVVSPGSEMSDGSSYAGMMITDLRLMMYKSASLLGSLGDKMNFTCQVYSGKWKDFKTKNANIITGSEKNPVISFASRGNLSFVFQNEYKTDIPGKGNTTVVSLKFTYPMISTFPGLKAITDGSGHAKLLQDNDTGQWVYSNFSFEDGSLAYSPSGGEALENVQLDQGRLTPPTITAAKPSSRSNNFVYIGVQPINISHGINPINDSNFGYAKSNFPRMYQAIGARVVNIKINSSGNAIVIQLDMTGFDLSQYSKVKSVLTEGGQWLIVSECTHDNCI